MDFHCVLRRNTKELVKRRCNFSDSVAKSNNFVDIAPDKTLLHQFANVKHISAGVQCTGCSFSTAKVNTDSLGSEGRGMHHTEGGWPRDVNPHEQEQVARYRKKLEKEESYGQTVPGIGKIMEHYVKQNNSINIYRNYFADAPELARTNQSPLKTIHVLWDPPHATATHARSVTSVSWSPEGAIRLAAAYSQPFWKNLFADKVNDSYIWNIERPFRPEITLQSTNQIQCLAFNPRDQHCLAGGTINGSIGIWDARRCQGPSESTRIDSGHQDTVTSVVWTSSKTGGEFFSTSYDGQVFWWDMRKMSVPLDALIIDPSRNAEPTLESALPACCMECDPSMPNKFLIGTRQGTVFSCNRRARSASERILNQYDAHLGPVYALHRHPQLAKIFLTVGDWTCNIWTEDIRESPILSLRSQNIHLLAGAWSYTRPSVLFTAGSNGSIYTWDILVQKTNPILNFKIGDAPLLSLSTQEQGKLIAVGDQSGALAIVQISDALSSVSKNDRASLTTLLERETRREKMLETRGKDGKVKTNRPMAAVAMAAMAANSITDKAAENSTFLLEPPADLISSVPADQLVCTPLTETGLDETLIAAEEAFFDTIDQDIISRRGQMN